MIFIESYQYRNVTIINTSHLEAPLTIYRFFYEGKI